MNRKKGFTLAELLIVVAIIGVLVAVSVPVFTAQRRTSIRTETSKATAPAPASSASRTLPPPMPPSSHHHASTQ